MRSRLAVLTALMWPMMTMMSLAATAHAQARATTFAELPGRLVIGETVFVTTRAGQLVKGKVLHVLDTVLVLRHGTGDVRLTAEDVLRIARRGHAVRNGALIGLAGGFAIGSAWAGHADECTYTCFSGPAGVLAFGGLFGAVGMGLGAGVGAAVRREDVVFASQPTGRVQAALLPSLTRAGPAMLVRISW